MKLGLAGLRVLELWIVVAHDDDIGIAEKCVVLVAPFADAAGHRGCDVAELHRSVGVLLPFCDEHELLGLHCRDQLRQPVEHAADTREFPDPSTFPIRLPLAESLAGIGRVEAHDLEQDDIVLVAVGIGVANGPLGAAVRLGRLVGTEALIEKLLPRLEKLSAAITALRSLRFVLDVIDEIKDRAAALRARVVPNMFANVVGARAVGVAAVPAQLFARAPVRLAPQFDASGLAMLLEVGKVAHALPSASCQRPQMVFLSLEESRMNQLGSSVGGIGMQRQPFSISGSSALSGTLESR